MNSLKRLLGINLVSAAAVLMFSPFAANDPAQTSRPGQQSSGPPASGSPAQSAGRAMNTVLVSPDQDYRIGLNDVLDVKVEGAPELTQSYRVTAAGTFLVPWIGRVTALNKTPEELAADIADKLRGDYLKDPKVSVVVTEYNSRSLYVLGEGVRMPGVYRVEGRPSMLELLTLAGGLSETHGSTAFIMHRVKTPDNAAAGNQKAAADGEAAADYELKTANINGLLKGDFRNNVLLEPGDIVNVPAADVFYVAGEVNAPGKFSLKEGTSLRQAISLAQGTSYKAALSRGIIFRESSVGKREEVRVDIGAIMSGKKADIPISPNDIIMVPNSKTKSIGGALLRAFGLTTISRVPIP